MKHFLGIIICILLYSQNIYAIDSSLNSYKHPLFERFSKFKLPKLSHFSQTHLSQFAKYKSVFYPFGGPDILYPLILFPHADSYTLIGLERGVQDINCLSKVNHQILDRQLASLLKRSFFVTADMSRQITKECGVLPILIAQLQMLECVIKTIKAIEFDFGTSIEISFDYLNQQKKLLYIRSNISDSSLHQTLIEYIKDHQLADICMIKASSYSMHNQEFSKIRNLIIQEAKAILQDDTGIPARYLNQPFNTKLFGNYIEPYGKEWANYKQNDLRLMYSSHSTLKAVNFCYGYGCGRTTPAIMISTKKLNQS